MDIETRKRIRAYKKALPELRERVIAVALLLAMSASMLTSASFAWLTISRRPEVSGVSTTVAANGNLEIALATGKQYDPVAPNESEVGDSSAAQDVTKANLTWGNLINLSDPRYGLDNLILRPAQLNTSSLLISPLYGAKYKQDGRVEKLNSDFGFATWHPEHKLFMVPTYGDEKANNLDSWGVRAICSTTYEAVGFAMEVKEKRDAAESANLSAGAAYSAITNNSEYMATLSTVMGTFMTAKMNKGQADSEHLTNPTMNPKDIQNLRDLFADFIAVYDLQYEAFTQLINYQLFLLNNSDPDNNPKVTITADDLKTTYTTEKLLKDKVNPRIELSEMVLKNKSYDMLTKMKTDYKNLCDGYDDLVVLAQQGTVKWADSGLDGIVTSLMDTGTCTLDGTPINNIGVSNATGYLDGKTHNAEITNGVLYNFEYLNGSRCYVEGLEVSATVKRTVMGIPAEVPATIKANILTNAPKASLFNTDLIYSDTLNKGAKGVEVAQDTYGLALDLWVRTNAESSYLTLEGNVLTTSEWVQVTGTDINGKTVDIYTLTQEVEVLEEETTEGNTETTETTEAPAPTTESVTFDVYKVETKGTDGATTITWYKAINHAPVTLNEGDAPKPKMEEVFTVIGYEGENRIWEDAEPWLDNSQLSLDSTTQGSGSCYVYYADSPEDQARSLELLESMNVAFVDDEGTLLATAIMDTERKYVDNGRVTVPLVLRPDSIEIGTNMAGETLYGITLLEKNVPTRITAIVYLDGTLLKNEHVLSASDIQGQLNIQFGSSVSLSHAKDENLLNATRTVSATVDKTSHSFDEYKTNNVPMRSTVTVTVNGDAPSTVTAFFIRSISSTQGSREKAMTFANPSGDGVTWVATHDFKAPGNYVLRSVELDGQAYDLAICPEVKIEGFAVESLSYRSTGAGSDSTGNHVNIMTAASASSVGLDLTFASTEVEAMPGSVQGRFLRTDGTAVNVNFAYDATSGKWTGTANFITSGEYTLQYLVLDGEYNELPETLQKTASVKLGMKTAVYTTSPLEFKFTPDEWDPDKEEDQKKSNLYMQVEIKDNSGNPLIGRQDAHLYYAMEGSSVLENGLDVALTWNGITGFYEGKFISKVGRFNFSHVTLGGNTITYAETSPLFRIMSPEPPAFIGVAAEGIGKTAYHPNRDAYMTATIDNSSTATVMALISRGVKNDAGAIVTTERYYIVATEGIQNAVATIDESGSSGSGSTTWKFYLPNGEGSTAQDGYWTMEELYVWDYWTKEGQLITTELHTTENGNPKWDYTTEGKSKWIKAENLNFTEKNACMRINVQDKGYWKKVIEKPNVTITPASGFDSALGKDGNTVNGVFMDTYTLSAPTITIVDFEKAAIPGASVTLEYIYGNNSASYGGYTSESLNNAKADVKFTISAADGKTFTSSEKKQVMYAGTYTTNLICKIGDTVCPVSSEDVKALAFSIHSVTPAVKITSAYYGNKGSDGQSTFTDTTTTVVYREKQETSCGITYDNYTPANVTLTLSGYGNATGASLAFTTSNADGKVHLYEDSQKDDGTSTNTYAWTGNGGCRRHMGWWESKTGNDEKAPAGTLTGTKLVLTHATGSYEVDIPDIIISNPS